MIGWRSGDQNFARKSPKAKTNERKSALGRFHKQHGKITTMFPLTLVSNWMNVGPPAQPRGRFGNSREDDRRTAAFLWVYRIKSGAASLSGERIPLSEG